jgi:pantoate--beta-alanine ligase
VLLATESAVHDGELDPDALCAEALTELRRSGLEPEYYALVNPRNLTRVERIDGPVLAVVAARVGTTRLIDNHPVSTVDSPARPVAAGTEQTTKGS